MKKLTAGIFATLLTVVTVGVANADIASTAWVNSKIGEVNVGVDSKIEGVQQTVNADIAELNTEVLGLASEVETFGTALTTAEGKITTLETDVGKKLDSTTASNTYAQKTALDNKLDKNLGTGKSGYILTVDSNGAITSSATIAQSKVNGLTTTLAGKANASALTALETDVGNKLDKNLGTGKSGQILTVGSDGAITSSATIAQGKVDGLTAALDGKANASALTALEQTVEGKADASALTALDTEVEGKQDKLSAAQLSAVNSGITESKVSTYDGYNSKITTATETATEAKTAADAATEAASTATSTANAAKSAAETATSTANAAKSAADAATEAAESAASSASSAVTSANKAIPKPASTTNNTDGIYVLTYNNSTQTYAWELITR